MLLQYEIFVEKASLDSTLLFVIQTKQTINWSLFCGKFLLVIPLLFHLFYLQILRFFIIFHPSAISLPQYICCGENGFTTKRKLFPSVQFGKLYNPKAQKLPARVCAIWNLINHMKMNYTWKSLWLLIAFSVKMFKCLLKLIKSSFSVVWIGLM